jgi:hypothetical protein
LPGAIPALCAYRRGPPDAIDDDPEPPAVQRHRLRGAVPRPQRNGDGKPPWGADTISAADIINNEIRTEDIKDANVTTADFRADSITTGKIADGEVGSADVLDDSLGAGDLGVDSVGTAELVGGAVGTSEIGANAVLGRNLAGGAVPATFSPVAACLAD